MNGPGTDGTGAASVGTGQAGLMLLGYRFYSPDTGRFLTRDPEGYDGGINLYSYTRNNPILNFDPSGTDEKSELIAGQARVQGRKEALQQLERAAAAKAAATEAAEGAATQLAERAAVRMSLLRVGGSALLKAGSFAGPLSLFLLIPDAHNAGVAIGEHLYGSEVDSVEAEEADQPLISPIPDSYIYAQYSIDMTPGPKSRTNAAGHPRNGPWFWKQMLEKFPEQFSPSNVDRITAKNPTAPRVDAQWVKYYPSHHHYIGDVLTHHHIAKGAFAVGLPTRIHHRYHGVLHY